MIDIAELEQYFPKGSSIVIEKPFTFKIALSQDIQQDIFVINLKIKQEDTKEGHLIKFKLGMGKDKETNSKTHDTYKPHFEIDIYKREDSFSANIYFTFDRSSDEEVLDFAKGTIVIISKIVEKFLQSHSLSSQILSRIIYSEEVKKDLGKYEPVLIDALYKCYKNSNLIVRQKGEVFVIKTPHYLTKYLNVSDLEPLYVLLFERIKQE